MSKKMKPLAARINDWDMKEILYKCPVCGISFATLGTRIKYCYNCGQGIDWNVLQKLSNTITYMYATQYDGPSKFYNIDEFKENFINELNAKQQNQ